MFNNEFFNLHNLLITTQTRAQGVPMNKPTTEQALH